MDPGQLSTEQWAQVGMALKFLWGAFLCAIVAGTSLLAAHALIPSAVSTSTISSRWIKARPIFYLVGFAGLLGIALFLFLSASETGWIRDLYPRFWQ
jgi:hypothetical protein